MIIFKYMIIDKQICHIRGDILKKENCIILELLIENIFVITY